MDLATASRASKRLQAAGKKITTVTRVAHGTRGPQAKGARLFNSLFATHSDILIRVVCTHGLEAPDLWLRVRRTDMIYVLKVKLEIALATVVQKSLRAEDLDLERVCMPCGQGAGAIDDVPSCAEIVERTLSEARETIARLGAL